MVLQRRPMQVYGLDAIPACTHAEEIAAICRNQIDFTNDEIDRERVTRAHLEQVLGHGLNTIMQDAGTQDTGSHITEKSVRFASMPEGDESVRGVRTPDPAGRPAATFRW